MDVAVLEPLRVRVDGTSHPMDAPEQRAIFGVLLEPARRAVEAERLLEEAWSGRPPTGG